MKKNLQIQLGVTVKHISVDLIIDNEGVHLFYDNLGDVSNSSLKINKR